MLKPSSISKLIWGFSVVLCATLFLFKEVSAYAQTTNDGGVAPDYNSCMALATGANAQQGLDYATQWMSQQENGAAIHCMATARMNLGQFGEAANLITELASVQPPEQLGRKAALLGQAGQIWEQEGNLEKAIASYGESLKIDPQNPQVWKSRAIAYARQKQWNEVIQDLDFSHALDTKNVDTLVLRATAYRYVNLMDRAKTDIARALRLDPISVAAFLERGNIRSSQGDHQGAREDWTKVTALGPGTPQSGIAERNLQKLQQLESSTN